MTIRTISSTTLAVNNFIESNIDSIFVITSSIVFTGDEPTTLTMPANSKLVFKSGGRLCNCIFNGQKALNDYVDIQWFSPSSGANYSSLAAAVSVNDNIHISGTCTLEKKYVIDRSGVRLFGSHPSDAIIQGVSFFDNSNYQNKVMNLIEVSSKQSYITIENITFKGYRKLSNLPDKRKEDDSYLFKGNGNHTNIIIKGCVFDSATGGIIILPHSQHINIEGCLFKNMVFIPTETAGGYGVVLHQSSVGEGSDHVIIRNCIFEKTVIRHAMYIQSSNDVLITNNIVYGTTEYNTSTLINKYYQYAVHSGPALTSDEIASIDVTKHMIKFDSAISYRGCADIRIIDNYFQSGLIVMNGSKGPTSTSGVTIKGRFFLVKDNVIKSFCVPDYDTPAILYNWNNIDNYRLVNNDEIDITYPS